MQEVKGPLGLRLDRNLVDLIGGMTSVLARGRLGIALRAGPLGSAAIGPLRIAAPTPLTPAGGPQLL
jgi:hypothetical protein